MIQQLFSISFSKLDINLYVSTEPRKDLCCNELFWPSYVNDFFKKDTKCESKSVGQDLVKMIFHIPVIILVNTSASLLRPLPFSCIYIHCLSVSMKCAFKTFCQLNIRCTLPILKNWRHPNPCDPVHPFKRCHYVALPSFSLLKRITLLCIKCQLPQACLSCHPGLYFHSDNFVSILQLPLLIVLTILLF